MDLQKIKTLIEFVGRSRISELVVSQDGTTVRISNSISRRAAAADNPGVARQLPVQPSVVTDAVDPEGDKAGQTVIAPVFGLLHRSPSPGAPPFVDVKAGYIAAYKAGNSVVEVSNLEAVLKAKGLVIES